MSNQHAVALPITGLAIPSLTEIVVLSLTPFRENQVPGTPGDFQPIQGPGAQGVVLDFNMNITTSIAQVVTIRFRYGSLTGGIVTGYPTAGTVVTTSTVAINLSAWALDPTLQFPAGVTYVATMSMGSAGTAQVNSAILTALDATSVE
jgi:hypothetical protein